jgi:hypothetical protein
MSTDTSITYRDEAVGAALRELETPAHGASFDRELRALLAAERAQRLRRAHLRWGVRLAAAAAVAAVAALAIGIPRTSRTPHLAGPAPASAALVQAKLRAALTSLRNLSGVVVSDGPGATDRERWQFVLDAAGDFRLEGPGPGEAIVYDAATGVARSAERSASLGGGPLFYAERDGVAPGPPDQGPPTWILPEQLGAFVRAALAARDPRVREVAYEGRQAWQLDVDVAPNAIVPDLSGDRLSITVDRETGIPVRVVELRRGNVLRTLRIEQVAVDRDLPAGTFDLRFPAGAEVMRSDDGFRRVGLDEVAGAVGYRPLVPAWLPDGYRLAEVAVARESAATGAEAGNPQSRMVVSLCFRRGLDRFLVTTRLRGNGSWSDPLATGEGFLDHPEPVTLSGGALAGADARLVIAPRGIPHLWATTSRLVVTVGGDLSRDELLRVAESLQER